MKCQVENCPKNHYAKGMCNMHYQRWRKHGVVAGPARSACRYPGCFTLRLGSGYCKKHYMVDARLKSRYGISLEERDAMIALQGNQCAGCRSPLGDWCSSSVHVDHDHETGAVRGVLCFACNTFLGKMGESPEKIHGLARYAERFTETRPADGRHSGGD